VTVEAQVPGFVDSAHAPPADLFDDTVRTQQKSASAPGEQVLGLETSEESRLNKGTSDIATGRVSGQPAQHGQHFVVGQ
jgi:hypothetical protein